MVRCYIEVLQLNKFGAGRSWKRSCQLQVNWNPSEARGEELNGCKSRRMNDQHWINKKGAKASLLFISSRPHLYVTRAGIRSIRSTQSLKLTSFAAKAYPESSSASGGLLIQSCFCASVLSQLQFGIEIWQRSERCYCFRLAMQCCF